MECRLLQFGLEPLLESEDIHTHCIILYIYIVYTAYLYHSESHFVRDSDVFDNISRFEVERAE